MGDSGAKLVRGVCDDCVRGALVDCGVSRCLPAPVAAADVLGDGTVSAAGAAKALRGILSLAGVGGQARQQQRRQPHATGDSVILERRIPPTALLVEVMVALTPNEDRDAHGRYRHLCAMDPRTLVNDRVLLVQQYHSARHDFGRANSMVAVVWNDMLRSGVPALSRPTATTLHREMELLPTTALFEDSAPLKQQYTHAPRTLAELRNRLEQPDENTAAATTTTTSATTSGGRAHFGYEAYVSRCLAAHIADTHALRRMRWALVGGALLAVDEEKLRGTQRLWSRLLLRNAFIIAQHAATPQERARDTQATVRLFLLAALFATPAADAPAAQQMPWRAARVRNLPQFLAAQVRLAEALESRPGDCVSAQDARKRQEFLTHFKAAAGLHNSDANNSAAWCLVEPLLELPEIAALWLQETFFAPPHDLLAWITARIDRNDTGAAVSLATWLTFLERTGYDDTAFLCVVLTETTKHCAPQQLQQLREWVHAPSTPPTLQIPRR
ncbi:hypothetical protein DQ04_12681000 [Trypanosoma grayi]|uniref:hypothetical protein n=1 Tax=Trypanosoma grayi TaxID=71804 RepID=UPI0004F41B10|nr:hypothetical protein DQ04_12681000 [Trypanosoma grayi]KEG06701.1 hypothetical protein DQ04_12681000 [Trypanosoma grayi]